jgi:hypothetical protein
MRAWSKDYQLNGSVWAPSRSRRHHYMAFERGTTGSERTKIEPEFHLIGLCRSQNRLGKQGRPRTINSSVQYVLYSVVVARTRYPRKLERLPEAVRHPLFSCLSISIPAIHPRQIFFHPECRFNHHAHLLSSIAWSIDLYYLSFNP